MTFTPSNQAASRPSSWLTWLALLAFLLQGLLVQTHIHMASLQASVPTQQTHKPAPKAPDECPACQLYAATAAALTPTVPILSLSLHWVESHVQSPPALARASDVHRGWQSRAPPVR
jgi:hypothetical protein